MQVIEQKHFMDRCLYYATLPIQKQVKKGKWNYELQPLHVISILNFNLWKDNEQCINYHSLMNEETHTKMSDKLQFVTVELPKFNKLATELENDTDKWLFCMKHLSTLSEQPTEIQGEVFDELFEIADLEQITQEDMKRYYYLKSASPALQFRASKREGFLEIFFANKYQKWSTHRL
jgi:predicted transposase/invertase (TIGR01784 family)